MKKKVIASILLAVSLFVTGCGGGNDFEPVVLQPQPLATAAPESVPILVPVPVPTPEPTPEPERVITVRVEKDGMIQSYLTGEWVDAAIGRRRPIAVSIPNHKSCLPQYGITNAAVIYQVPLRDNLTRLFCIFEDYDDLDRIGPIRSIRDYMISVGLEHDAIICHWGAVVYAVDLVNSSKVDTISQATENIKNPTPGAYSRYNRGGNYNQTDSAFMFVDGLVKGIEEKGYDQEYDDDFMPKFLFAADGFRASYDEADSATKIWPGEKGNYNTVGAYFEYNEDTQKYDYYEYGHLLKDGHSGTTLQVDNVVLQVCYAEERDANGYLRMEMCRDHENPGNGDGRLVFFTNGKVIEGYWERKYGEDKPAKYYDMDGNELVFNQGKTFICEIWDKWEDYIKYE